MLLRTGSSLSVAIDGYQRLWFGRNGSTEIELSYPVPDPPFARRIVKNLITQNDRAALLVGCVYADANDTTPANQETLKRWLEDFCQTGRRDFLSRIDGSFTLVLIDLANLRILIAGDLRSLFPIYHTANDSQLSVSWRISPLRKAAGRQLAVSHGSILSALANGLLLGPNTYYQGIRRLSPGGFILLENGRTTIDRYWRRDFSKSHTVTGEEFSDCISRVVNTEIARAGTDYALALSGGIDSRALLAVIARAGLKPDSVTWGQDRLDMDFGDFQAGAKLARHTGLPHQALPLDTDRLGDNLKAVVDLSEGNLLHVGSLPHGEAVPRDLSARYRTVLFGAQCFGMSYRGYGLKQALLGAGVRTGWYVRAAASLLRPRFRREALEDYYAQLEDFIRPYRSLPAGDVQDIVDYNHTSPGMEANIHWIWLRHVYTSCPLDRRPILELSNGFSRVQRFDKAFFTDTVQRHLWSGEAWATNTKHSRIDWNRRVRSGGKMACDLARIIVEPGPFFEVFDRDRISRWLGYFMPDSALPTPVAQNKFWDFPERILWNRTRPHQLAHLAVIKLADLF